MARVLISARVQEQKHQYDVATEYTRTYILEIAVMGAFGRQESRIAFSCKTGLY